MKYMGSKRSMLTNGLGELLKLELPKCERFVDLFCGGGSVSWFAATEADRPVFAVDLQDYATALAAAVISRTVRADAKTLESNWLEASIKTAHKSTEWKRAEIIGQGSINTATWCARTRGLVDELGDTAGLVTRSYGGHYFSLQQSLILDAMLELLPEADGDRAACLAATIICASQCAAAPGHTAQPFQPTRKAAKFLREAWKRDPQYYAGRALEMICGKHAKTAGSTQTGDAVEIAGNLNPTDLVFVDPPYSAVHYSRFYHVLETIARRKAGEISGVGRYPPQEERPTSDFSMKGQSLKALQKLLSVLAERRCTVILTFPLEKCSNGLAGSKIEELAKPLFTVENRKVKSRFSTLGGNNIVRTARANSDELILLFRPKVVSPKAKNPAQLRRPSKIRIVAK